MNKSLSEPKDLMKPPTPEVNGVLFVLFRRDPFITLSYDREQFSLKILSSPL